MKREIKIIFPGVIAMLLFSGCVSTEKKSEKDAKAMPAKELKKPFPESVKPSLANKNAPDKKVEPATESRKIVPVLKPVKSEKKPEEPASSHSKALNRCLPSPEASPFLKPDSFVMCWQVSGPYPISPSVIKMQGAAIIHHEFVQQEKKLTGFVPIPGGIEWKTIPAPLEGPMGKINLDDYWKKAQGPSAAYAATSLYCPVEMKDLTLMTGSSDYIKIWINGKLEQTYNREQRAGKFDQDSVKGINLLKGSNYIVVKTLCFKPPWDFYLRFADAKGMPISILPTIAR